ncbi:MAG: hypothetical protein RMK16_00810 [Acidobacteriota bacterium]|nr:hypothetical protein [Acidobacteriota bacterium]
MEKLRKKKLSSEDGLVEVLSKLEKEAAADHQSRANSREATTRRGRRPRLTREEPEKAGGEEEA